ncbi:MAG TPA: hypothetical protein VNS63_20880 [Blastocatellia bacterium]|nr:hypothetical protein [Blastocatellia bacterium]
MNEVFVMRRANGTFFTEEINSKLRLPVWSSEEAVMRFKERNPELGVFLPHRFSRAMLKNLAISSGTEGTPELFLLSDEDPDADLEDGKPITLEEVFPDIENPHTRASSDETATSPN